ncbi:MAG: J domain-containing protein [SAR202 cluster bacterium]|nr:J domain-containing protein [SAR202 cluster bacterium]MDP6799344.1 J domain-containing protein [SAR202 cluster bacterium]
MIVYSKQRRFHMADYYSTLGVNKNASDKDIRQAFRKAARKFHPDLNPGDKDAEARFKEINEAYGVLSDGDSRKKYDRYGDRWKHADQIEEQSRRARSSPFGWSSHGQGGNPFGQETYTDLGDFLGARGDPFGLGRSRRRSRIRSETSVEVSLEDAFTGTTVVATLTVSGRARRYEVNIPPGVDNGSTVRITPNDVTELMFNVTVTPHTGFTRRGDNLYTEAKIPFEDVILGGEAETTTLDGRRIRVRVPANSQNGQSIRLRGQGMPKLGSPDTRGDLFVALRPELPTELTDEMTELILKIKELRSEDE